tara:strand:+ start:121 stop:2448 length:2328 start_codon:yes stop_codon:yes gene_type:complete
MKKGFGNNIPNNSYKKKYSDKSISVNEIVVKAIKSHSEGNINEAIKLYKYCINQKINNPIIFSNYGVILKSLGKYEEAEKLIRKAIEINSKFSDAHGNLGVLLKELGRFEEAEKYVRNAIEINPNEFNYYYNLTIILTQLSRLEEAEIVSIKAIKLNPNDFFSHFNFGILLKELGKFKEAEKIAKKAIKLNANSSDAYCNLGIILKNLGKLKEAEINTLKAIEINQNSTSAYFNYGNILSELGKSVDALNSYLKVIELDKNKKNIFSAIADLFKSYTFSEIDKTKLKELLLVLLKRDDIEHSDLFSQINQLFEYELIKEIKNLEKDLLGNYFFKEIISEEILKLSMKKMIFRSIYWEKLFKLIRMGFLDLISNYKLNFNNNEMDFIFALAQQCSINEYIYTASEKEKKDLNQILLKDYLSEIEISIVACYLPLYKINKKVKRFGALTSSNHSFNEMIKLTLLNDFNEAELAKKIKVIGSISNKISKKVMSQYESNPYPRWVSAKNTHSNNLTISQAINNEIRPNIIEINSNPKKIKVLIAGCGTGYQIVQSQRYSNAEIVAIDLSASSLSYAQRKINEFGIKNVDFIKMDILDVNLLEKEFDLIECGGVLHHMSDPNQGLESLLKVLKNKGFLRLAFYSELARQDVVKARKEIETNKLKVDDKNIRAFRDKIISGELDQLDSLKSFQDFYSLSEFRDLCFHFQEHRFSINQLEKMISSYKLAFLGFSLPPKVKNSYSEIFPNDSKHTNLRNWSEFEAKNPNTFRGMYQFWVSKLY